MGFFGGGGGGTTPVNMVGASTGTAGTAGYVPAPAAGEQNAVLGGQGTFLPAVVRPKLGSTRYYAPIVFGAVANATLSVSMDVRAYITNPIYLPAITVANLRVRHNANAGANGTMYVALYDSNSDGVPNAPIITTSHTFTTTQGAITKTMAISPTVAIKAGVYYGVCYLDSATSVVLQTCGRVDASLFGVSSSDSPGNFSNNQAVYFSNSKTGGTWENPAGTLTYINSNSSYLFYLEVGV
jgi:hypothetical protein